MTVATLTPESNDPLALLDLFVAIRDETATAGQFRGFEDLLRRDAGAIDYFARFMQIHVLLERRAARPTVGPSAYPVSETMGFPDVFASGIVPAISRVEADSPLFADTTTGIAPETSDAGLAPSHTDHPRLAPNGLPIIICSPPDGPVGFFSSDWPRAYLSAAVIMGIGLLIAAFIPVYHHVQFARQSDPTRSAPASRPAPRARSSSEFPTMVGQVTGMVDCQWSDPQTEAYSGASVPLGRKFALSSGLMQITYHSGAKVILQGPCTYEVESETGGYLSLGKLTARVEKRSEARGQRSVASNQKSKIKNF